MPVQPCASRDHWFNCLGIRGCDAIVETDTSVKNIWTFLMYVCASFSQLLIVLYMYSLRVGKKERILMQASLEREAFSNSLVNCYLHMLTFARLAEFRLWKVTFFGIEDFCYRMFWKMFLFYLGSGYILYITCYFIKFRAYILLIQCYREGLDFSQC